MRLRQFSHATGSINDDGKLVLSEPSSKLDDLMEFYADNTKPLVVFAASKQLIMLAAERFKKAKIPFGLVTGDQTIDERVNYVRMFQEGRLQILLCTLAAGGTGLTMTAADTVYFLERSYSRLENEQAEGRVYRIGSEQHASISVVICLAEQTIDDNKEAQLAIKEDRFQEIVRDTKTLKRMLSQ
jgi:SNF2 family DNA or RNA helicase